MNVMMVPRERALLDLFLQRDDQEPGAAILIGPVMDEAHRLHGGPLTGWATLLGLLARKGLIEFAATPHYARVCAGVRESVAAADAMSARVEAAVPNAAAAAEAEDVAIEALRAASATEAAPQKKTRAKPVRRAYTDTQLCGLSPRSFYRACASHGATAVQIRDAISRRTGVEVEMGDVRHEVWCVKKSRKPVPEHDAAAVLEFLGVEAVAAG